MGRDGRDTNADEERRAPGSSSARKVLQLLFAFDENRTSATVAELAALGEIPLPTAYRHVALLKDLGLLEEGRGGQYRPTMKVLPLAQAARLSNSLADLARPLIAEASAAFDETVMLKRYTGDGVICVEVKETDQAMRFTFQRGRVTPLGRGGSGKMALAMLPAETRRLWLRSHGDAALEAECALIAERGYAISESEIDRGVWACSVPATTDSTRPIVLTVAGPDVRFDEATRAAAPQLLKRYADRIAALVAAYDI
ncbi:IclR family transcriptional regulator [Microbacterium sp. NPDC096154]|uniref:IclR family transcriptional regulator n=1 Tax=Microbacterium sp. NPDC096154 TaxID=3155549 RepID=UPI0033175364